MAYTIKQRMEGIMSNMEHQNGKAWSDDIEKMEHLLALMIQGKSLNDDFEWVEDHSEVIKEHLLNWM